MAGLFSINAPQARAEVKLPPAQTTGKVSIEQAISRRRSVREYKKDQPLSLKEISQLLWSAQGITAEWGGRAAPSAGASYPLEIYLVAAEVTDLAAGVYHYLPEKHALLKVAEGDQRAALCSVCLSQASVKNAAISLVISARYEKITQKYGERARPYVYIEAGHVGQNIYLQAESLGLGTCAIGAFDANGVKQILGIEEEPVYIMPVGKI